MASPVASRRPNRRRSLNQRPEPEPEPQDEDLDAEDPDAEDRDAEDLDAEDVPDFPPPAQSEREPEPPGALDDPEEHFLTDDNATSGTTTDRAPDTDD